MNTSEQDIDLRRVTFSIFQDAADSEKKNDAGKNSSGKVIVVTSPISGEGVTYVAMQMCKELSRDPKRRTLYCTIDALSHISPHAEDEIERRCLLTVAGFWTLSSRSDEVTDWDFDPWARRAVLDPLRRSFDYVIVDCPAVCASADVAGVAGLVNSCLVVVGAGMSTRKQLVYTEQLITSSGGTLGGCILNRRQSPIPKLVYRLLRRNLS
jgi:Mrp family chromosome partitioning ATPase